MFIKFDTVVYNKHRNLNLIIFSIAFLSGLIMFFINSNFKHYYVPIPVIIFFIGVSHRFFFKYYTIKDKLIFNDEGFFLNGIKIYDKSEIIEIFFDINGMSGNMNSGLIDFLFIQFSDGTNNRVFIKGFKKSVEYYFILKKNKDKVDIINKLKEFKKADWKINY